MRYTWLDGRILPESEALIPVGDRGLQFGEGAFTTMRVNDGFVEAYWLHCRRLDEHCRFLHVPAPRIDSQSVIDLIRMNHAEKGLWRLKVLVTPEHRVMMMAPVTLLERPRRLGLYPHPLSGPLQRIKSLSYFSRFLISRWAEEAGYDDALVCNPDGQLLESSMGNLFWVSQGQLYYPDPSLDLLHGITLQLIEKAGHPVRWPLESVPADSQVYICNAVRGIQCVQSIGDRSYTIDDRAWRELVCVLDRRLRLTALGTAAHNETAHKHIV